MTLMAFPLKETKSIAVIEGLEVSLMQPISSYTAVFYHYECDKRPPSDIRSYPDDIARNKAGIIKNIPVVVLGP